MMKTKQSGIRTPGKARSAIHFCNTGKGAQRGKWNKQFAEGTVLAASYYNFQLIGCSQTGDICLEFATETNTEKA